MSEHRQDERERAQLGPDDDENDGREGRDERGRGKRGGSESWTSKRPRGFFLVAALLAIVLGFAFLSADPVDPKVIERNYYKVVQLLHDGQIKADSMEVIPRTGEPLPHCVYWQARYAAGHQESRPNRLFQREASRRSAR